MYGGRICLWGLAGAGSRLGGERCSRRRSNDEQPRPATTDGGAQKLMFRMRRIPLLQIEGLGANKIGMIWDVLVQRGGPMMNPPQFFAKFCVCRCRRCAFEAAATFDPWLRLVRNNCFLKSALLLTASHSHIYPLISSKLIPLRNNARRTPYSVPPNTPNSTSSCIPTQNRVVSTIGPSYGKSMKAVRTFIWGPTPEEQVRTRCFERAKD